MSTLSKRSRMRKTKTAKTKSAISTEKATLTSTTSGIPRAPVAARIRPFSMRHEADDLGHGVAP